MQKADVQNGVVVNVIEVDPNNIPDWCVDWPIATEECQIGGTYADGIFTRVPRAD
jgi:hypothetical protein